MPMGPAIYDLGSSLGHFSIYRFIYLTSSGALSNNIHVDFVCLGVVVGGGVVGLQRYFFPVLCSL